MYREGKELKYTCSFKYWTTGYAIDKYYRLSMLQALQLQLELAVAK